MAGTKVILLLVGLMALPAAGVGARRLSKGSVGTFNTQLFRGTPVFGERKDLVIRTVRQN